MMKALAYYTFLIPAWIAAWLRHEQTGLASLPPLGDTIYWTIAKLLLWILPVAVIVRHFRQPLADFLSPTGSRAESGSAPPLAPRLSDSRSPSTSTPAALAGPA